MTHGRTTGAIGSWGPDRATAVGLEDVSQGSLVEIEGSGPALVTALRRNEVELAPLSLASPHLRARVRAIGPLVTSAGLHLLGRTIDCLGNALDGAGTIPRTTTAPIFGRHPVDVGVPRRARLTLGTLVFDLQHVIEVGTSSLVVGPRELARHIMMHQAHEGRICIIATPAGGSAEYLAVWQRDLRCIHVAVGRDASAAAQWLVPWTAMAIAASLRQQGHDAVVLLDSLAAWRRRVGWFPEHGGWETQLARLASCAYAGARGSASLLARVDHPAPAPDGFDAVLDLRRVASGDLVPEPTKLVRPPINVPHRRPLGTACVAAALLREYETFPWIEPDDGVRPILSRAMRIRACLRYRPDLIDSTEQVLCLLAVLRLHELPTGAVDSFVAAYLAELRRTQGHRLAAIRQQKQLDDDSHRLLLEIASRVASSLPARPTS